MVSLFNKINDSDALPNSQQSTEDGLNDKTAKDAFPSLTSNLTPTTSISTNNSLGSAKIEDILSGSLGSSSDETNKMQVEKAKQMMEKMTTKQDSSSIEQYCKDVVKSACKAVGSLSDSEFCITFNPDLYHPHAQHVHSGTEEYDREHKILHGAAHFLVFNQLSSLPSQLIEQNIPPPLDGSGILDMFHSRGINMRYLGVFANMLKSEEQLSYLETLVIAQLIVRSTKHLFLSYIQTVSQNNISNAVSHFLNCLFASSNSNLASAHSADSNGNDHEQSKHNRRKNKKRARGYVITTNENTEWMSETPKSFWKKLLEEIKSYYGYQLTCDTLDDFFHNFQYPRICLLREICLSIGIQILLKDYFEIKQKPYFAEDDIIGLFPKYKHIHPKASDAYNYINLGQEKIQSGYLREGFALVTEAYNLLNNIYGVMHPDTVSCLRLLARLNYILGDYAEALSCAQRTVIMSERIFGVDSANTINEYINLALYCFAAGQVVNSLKLLYRARYIALLCHGENHPELSTIDSNIGLVMHAAGQFELSYKFFNSSLDLNTKFFGKDNLKTALSHHFLARTHSCCGDFRSALNSEKQAYTIYQTKLGINHERTRESSECLQHLTQQAVKLQRTVNELQKSGACAPVPPFSL